MEYNCKENKAETLRLTVGNILQKNSNLKFQSNLTKDEGRVLKELRRDDKLRGNKFDKGCGFVTATDDTAKKKIET